MGLKQTTGCLGFQNIASANSVVHLTPPTGATRAIIIAENIAVRWRDDLVAPTASVGMPLPVLTPLSYDGNLLNIAFIGQTNGASLSISYYQ